MTTPAGWYSDPSDGNAVRWWSGVAWTTHVEQKPTPTPGYVTAAAYAQGGAAAVRPILGGGVQPYALDGSLAVGYPGGQQLPDPTTMKRGERERVLRRLNPVAYAGMLVAVLGMIFSFLGLTAVAAIILSSLGLARATKLRSQGHLISGRGYSIAGLVLGILSLLYAMWMLVHSSGFLAGFQAGLAGH